MPVSSLRAAPLLGLLALAACATPDGADLQWLQVTGRANPTLMFGAAESDNFAFRLECDTAGTRLATFVPGVPRGVTAQDTEFQTRLRLFLGRTEVDLGATGTAMAAGGSMVEAPLPDPDAFFAALAAQNRLVAVTFAGRNKAPAPTTDMIATFRTRCLARG